MKRFTDDVKSKKVASEKLKCDKVKTENASYFKDTKTEIKCNKIYIGNKTMCYLSNNIKHDT